MKSMTGDERLNQLATYIQLARSAERAQRPLVRDRLLILAATSAAHLALPRIAEACRTRVLDRNPQHLIRRWPTIEEALGHPDFLHFLKQVQRRYPPEKSERLLSELGIDLGNERDAYYTDEEYAAALLGENMDASGDESS